MSKIPTKKEEYIKEIMKQEHQPENQNIYEIMQEIGRKKRMYNIRRKYRRRKNVKNAIRRI